MTSRTILWTLVLAGTVIAAPAYAGDRSTDAGTPDERVAPAPGDVTTPPARPGGEAIDAAPAPASQTIEGRVTAIERETGRLVLDTDRGPLSLMATPDELAGVEVGDIIRVSLIDDDR